jgi:DMSO/TMAO reductase YedYZ molybdopterin-dependent catalytic subunit
MKTPWVNILLLVLLLIQTLTGYLGLTNGHQPRAWVLWLHGIIAYALTLLLFVKAGVIVDAWRRKKRWTWPRVLFLINLILLLVTLLAGLLWTFDGPLYLSGFSLVSLHIYLAVPLMVLMLWHSLRMRFIFRVRGATGRRPFLAGLVAIAGALALWMAARQAKALAGWAGATRRFTGSYEVGSHCGEFPVVSWIADRPPPVDLAGWALRVEGAVERPFNLTYEELGRWASEELAATLDCTGGWYSDQQWRGAPVATLLELARPLPTAASVTFAAVSGYKRRFPLPEAGQFLLALGITDGVGVGRPLSHGHGFPARLVAPGRRGMEWVKWVTAIRVNETGPELQSPLPLS